MRFLLIIFIFQIALLSIQCKNYHLAFQIKNLHLKKHYVKNLNHFVDSLFDNLEGIRLFDSETEEKNINEKSDHLTLHVISDNDSNKFLLQAYRTAAEKYKFPENWEKSISFQYYNVYSLTEKLKNIVAPLQAAFGNHPNYNDPLFFLSAGFYQIFDKSINQLIITDIDLIFTHKRAVYEMFQQFDNFSNTQIIGLANEMQPVYHHIMQMRNGRIITNYHHEYKRKRKFATDKGFRLKSLENQIQKELSEDEKRVEINKKIVGGTNKPGFNTGVILLRLDRQRNSTFGWSAFLEQDVMEDLIWDFGVPASLDKNGNPKNTNWEKSGEREKKWNPNSNVKKAQKNHRHAPFRGHLGDQDYYTLINWAYPNKFIYTLPCRFNRQTCSYWLKFYPDLWQSYNYCAGGKISVLHGNCGTDISPFIERIGLHNRLIDDEIRSVFDDDKLTDQIVSDFKKRNAKSMGKRDKISNEL